MKRKKIVGLVVLVFVMNLLLLSCGIQDNNSKDESTEAKDEVTKQENSENKDKGEKTISVIVMALNSDYWHMVEAGAKLAGKEFGYKVNVTGPKAESDVVGQMNMIEDAIENKVDAIVLAPNEPKAVIPSVEKAKNAEVPLILIDAKLASDDDSLYKSFIGTGNVEAGRIAGEYLAKNLKAGDKVAIIRGLAGQPTHDERSEGAKEAFEKAGLKVVAIQPADSDRGKAVNVAENIIQSDPDIKSFYCTNDEMALGAYQAVQGAQLQDDVLIMGFDGSFGAMDSIAEGKLTASLAQKPIDEGYLGVKAAIDFLEGRDVEKIINNGVEVVDKNNVKEFRENIDARVAEAKE